MRFLEAEPADGAADALIQGAPYDGGVSYRAGAADAPEAIRAASDSIESYSPRTGRDLRDIRLRDAGDIECAGCGPEEAVARIAAETERRAREARLVVTFGGDHSISIGTSRGLAAVHPGLAHVVFDAHMDLREAYDGSPLSHACGTRHMALAGPTWVLGVRSGAREEYADAAKLLAGFSEGLEFPGASRALLAGRPVLLSVDMDVLDPGVMPGTGTPEPGGASYRDLREALLGFAGLNVVALDVVEVAPPLDPSGLSPVVAAELVRDCILGLLPA